MEVIMVLVALTVFMCIIKTTLIIFGIETDDVLFNKLIKG
jgi:hypothetical protein